MVFAILVVIGLGILLWNGKKNIEAKNVEYEKEISQLQAQVDSEQKRTDELNEYKKYIPLQFCIHLYIYLRLLITNVIIIIIVYDFLFFMFNDVRFKRYFALNIPATQLYRKQQLS